MDIAAVRDALRVPEPRGQLPDPDALVSALVGFAAAAARLARAETEAAVARRPSTLKATLKSTIALERARQHVLAELRLIGYLTETMQVPAPAPPTEPGHLRLCS
jgi:hypothetical protein